MICDSCKSSIPFVFMLNDDLWLQVNKGRRFGYLCIPCVVVRLGRKLRVSDFNMSLPANIKSVGRTIGLCESWEDCANRLQESKTTLLENLDLT